MSTKGTANIMARKQAGQGGIQMGLPTLDWKMCKCGCGSQFLLSGKGRAREYFNDSHKKRAYRDRMAERANTDAQSFQIWQGVSDDMLAEACFSDPEQYETQWAWYERDRRVRMGETYP